jgi:feruloyl esterase
VYKGVPAFCRVIAEARPSADSALGIEVWLPARGWNGELQSHGNGGFAGEIGYRLMAASVAQGYATAETNTGHSGSGTDASWALGRPEKVVDFGYRAIHEMTRTAKAAVKSFYGKPEGSPPQRHPRARTVGRGRAGDLQRSSRPGTRPLPARRKRARPSR